MINLDIALSERADLVADGHHLPFADASFDAVFSNAVLEHVERPWIVAEEIWRVLRPGGRVFVNVPFLNVIHDVEDYFRFTDKGLRLLFAKFDQISAGVSAGPSSFLGPFLIEYLLCFIPTEPLRLVMRQVFSIAAWPLKYADFLIKNNPRIRITADAFYFVGVKR
jgi:ubiquinone/menaquinone biosynthesis C-methylase UbiE